MLTLKKIDLIGQALIFGFGILILFTDKDKWIAISLLFSAPIGCWQTLSVLIHLVSGNKLITLKERAGYGCLVVGFFTLVPIFLGNEKMIAGESIGFLYFFLVSTSLAIWYFAISFRELTIWQKRRLIQFK